MGYNTVAVILNDRLYELERDGLLGARIAEAARRWWSGPREGRWLDMHFGAGQIVSCDHADGEQVVIVSRNGGQRADEANDLGWQAIGDMKACLERHGYTVTKKRKANEPARERAKASLGG